MSSGADSEDVTNSQESTTTEDVIVNDNSPWTVKIVDDTRWPSPSQNYALKMPKTTAFREIRSYLVKHSMVRYSSFQIISETVGSSYMKKIQDENKPLAHYFSFDDNIVLKLSTNRSYYNNSDDDDSDELPTHRTHYSSAYQRKRYERAKGYVGLSNQGATCYLNSLLQTLYMTPEFRQALYEWEFEETCKRDFYNAIRAKRKKKNEDGEIDSRDESTDDDAEFAGINNLEEKYENYKAKVEEKSISRQLQKLFLQLQLSEETSTETTSLTSSFGWSGDEAFTQHDVQELLRVLFDALETTWKGTEKENFINEMYQGEMKDYVRCCNCQNESSRTDTYLDIPLVIKGFGATKAVSSVDEAIREFTNVERLDGDNQYFCEKCDSKQDADKGLSYLSFPYLLALQLKRFDFDYMTMRRIKLNDRVTFPEILDMNQYLEGKTDLQEELPEDDARHDDSDDLDDDKESRKAKREEALQRALANGPYVYELYSILIHRGSAMGGHYYAYIKSFEKDQWYCFNDSSVTVINPSQIEETYGDIPKKRVHKTLYGRTVVSGNSQFGSNAYMLMYRRYDPNLNIIEPNKEQISPYLKEVYTANQERLEMEAQQAYKKRNRVLLKITYNDDTKEYKVARDLTLNEVAKNALEEFDLKAEEGCYRLREYQAFHRTEGRTFPDDTKTLEDLRFYGAKSLLLEIKTPEEEFEVYDPTKMTLYVRVFDEGKEEFSPPEKIRVSKTAKVAQLKGVLFEKFEIPVEEQIICKKDYNAFNAQVLSRETKDLRFNYRIQEGHTLWLEKKHPDADDDTYEYSYVTRMRQSFPEDTIFPKAFAAITEEKNKVTVKFTDPDGKDAKHSVVANKSETLGELKEKIAKKLEIPIDSFKIMKLSLRSELKVLTYTLNQYNISNNIPLLIVSGQPLKKGEVLIQFELFTPTKLASEVTPLFKLALPETMEISEVKEKIVEEYQATKLRIEQEKLNQTEKPEVVEDNKKMKKMMKKMKIQIL